MCCSALQCVAVCCSVLQTYIYTNAYIHRYAPWATIPIYMYVNTRIHMYIIYMLHTYIYMYTYTHTNRERWQSTAAPKPDFPSDIRAALSTWGKYRKKYHEKKKRKEKMGVAHIETCKRLPCTHTPACTRTHTRTRTRTSTHPHLKITNVR